MRISKLAASQRVRGRVLVYLEDGALLRVTENEVVAFGLYAGAEVDADTVQALKDAAHAAAVRGKAMDLIAGRPMSRKELTDRLTVRPRSREKEPLATREEAEAAADRLEELGYLNDREYARTLVRHYAAKGYGARKIRDELYRRGVPRELWDEALAQIEDNSSVIDAFLEKKLKGSHDPKDIKKAADALARRGYRWEEISAAMRRYGAEEEE